MDWTGVAPITNSGFAMLDTLAMVAMEVGLEGLELWRSLKILSLLNHG